MLAALVVANLVGPEFVLPAGRASTVLMKVSVVLAVV